MQSAIADSSEWVAAKATLGSPGHFIEFACQPLQHPIGLGGEGQGCIGGLRAAARSRRGDVEKRSVFGDNRACEIGEICCATVRM